MSSLGLKLHTPEESVTINFADVIRSVPDGKSANPISDYFEVTEKLKKKLIGSEHKDDAEILGLLTLGVISAAEFYVRNIVASVPHLCPIAQRHCELIVVPSGSFSYYAGSSYPHLVSCFDHESFADAAKIRAHSVKFTGLKIGDGSSVGIALEEFNKLCELRHCLVHARGYVGLKASSGLKLDSRRPAKVLLTQASALDVLKVCHNLVRALNSFLANGLAERWVERGVLSGEWEKDDILFKALVQLFWIKGEDGYGGVAYRAYSPYRKAALARAAAVLAKVGA